MYELNYIRELERLASDPSTKNYLEIIEEMNRITKSFLGYTNTFRDPQSGITVMIIEL
jgi:hypothetical protein